MKVKELIKELGEHQDKEVKVINVEGVIEYNSIEDIEVKDGVIFLK